MRFNRIKAYLTAITCMAIVSHDLYAQQPQSYQGKIGNTYEDSKEWWPEPVKAPAGAPNIIWILIDDVGFGASSTFGGIIPTPTFDSLANNGLRYTNFHTCAICAPTRAALLTGRNSAFVHESGFSHTRMSAGFPGWDGRVPSSAGTLAEILKENGYNTFAVGKYGITTDQYKPSLVEDNAHATPDGRHLSEQITDKANYYIARQQKAAPGKPFFLYYAPGAVHSPHQVDKYWSDQYKGRFDEGWDVYRQKVYENHKRLAYIPA